MKTNILTPTTVRYIASVMCQLLVLITLSLCGCADCNNDPTLCKRNRYEPHGKDTISLAIELDSLLKAGDNFAAAYVLIEQGRIARNASQFDLSIKKHSAALTMSMDLEDTTLIIKSLNNLGTDYRRTGNYANAATYHYQALDYTRLTDLTIRTNLKDHVTALNGLGNIYLGIGNYDEAEGYLRLALRGESQLGSSLGMAINNANLGSICEHRGQLDSASYYYEISMDLNRKAGSQLGIALCHTYRGSIMEKKGQLTNAAIEYERAFELMQNNEDQWHALTPAIAVARVNRLQGNTDKATLYINKAIAMAREINSPEHLSETYRLLSQIQLDKGDTKLALESHLIADAWADSVVNFQTLNRVQNVRFNVARQRQENDLRAARTNYIRERDAKKENNIVFLIVVGVALLTLALLSWNLRLRSRQQRIQADIQKAKDTFFTNITHEFRTPLSVITQAARAMKEEAETPDVVRREAEVITHHARCLLSLINQLLDIARLHSTYSSHSEKWQRGAIAKYVADISSTYVDHAKHRGINMTIDMGNATGVMADLVPPYVDKIFGNLISNAIKYNKQGGSIQILMHHDAPASLIKIEVIDTGLGMTDEQQKHIFEPFYRASDGRGVMGSGIGLSVVNMTASALGWKIEVDSVFGYGSTFTVSIPTKPSHAGAPLLESSEEHTTEWIDEYQQKEIKDSITSTPDNDTSRPIALVVEDTQDLAYYIGRQLSKNYDVMYATDGLEALNKIQEQIPNIIISDVMMPNLNGLDLCQRVRASDLTRHIPIILVTAKVTHEDRLRGLSAGADAYLEKPFHADELLLQVSKLIESRRLLQETYIAMALNQSPAPQPITPADSPNTPPISPADTAYAQKISDTIRDLIKQRGEVDASSVAELMCITRHQLNRKVNALLGMSTSALVAQIRIQMAKELLSQSDKPIGDIATDVGLDSVAYFSAIFKRLTGVTPSQFRQNNS